MESKRVKITTDYNILPTTASRRMYAAVNMILIAQRVTKGHKTQNYPVCFKQSHYDLYKNARL